MRRLRDQSRGHGSEFESGEDEDTDQDEQMNEQRRSQRQSRRSVTAVREGGKQVGWADLGPRLASRSQPPRAAARATRGHFREVESPSEDGDDWVTPGSLSPKRKRKRDYERKPEGQSKSRDRNRNMNKNVDDEVENGEDKDKSGEDSSAVEGDDEDEYISGNKKRAASRKLPTLRRSSRKRV